MPSEKYDFAASYLSNNVEKIFTLTDIEGMDKSNIESFLHINRLPISDDRNNKYLVVMLLTKYNYFTRDDMLVIRSPSFSKYYLMDDTELYLVAAAVLKNNNEQLTRSFAQYVLIINDIEDIAKKYSLFTFLVYNYSSELIKLVKDIFLPVTKITERVLDDYEYEYEYEYISNVQKMLSHLCGREW